MSLDDLDETAHILEGSVLRVRWMRYQGEFPARRFLEKYPEDFAQFLQRAREMADFGRIRLPNNGHSLGGTHSVLHQFNMKVTRSWGIRDGNVYLIVHAAKKRTTGQESDYEKAMQRRQDYFTGCEK